MSIECQTSTESRQSDTRDTLVIPVGDSAHEISWIPEAEFDEFQRGRRMILIAAVLMCLCLMIWVGGLYS
ncbi:MULTISPECIES: hypothetical protein [Paraburkholderia]|uniref:hypothetical protein n=1 Tax=Paraburkholderia TaxID=1822464 RepID=UPI002AB71130|nr:MULTISPECIES: hypothetical protein [Paraburkholderia]